MEAINWRHTDLSRMWREGKLAEMMNQVPVSGEKLSLKVRKNIDDDSVSLSTYWQTILSPKFRHAAYLALRITLMVALPLMLIAEKYANIFLMSIVLTLFGIVNSQDTVGEQVSMAIISLQVFVWSSTWGILMNACNVNSHPIAWWFAVFLVIFFLALFGEVRCRRVAILMTVLMMATQRAYPTGGYTLPLLVSRDLLVALSFACLQALVPPFTMSKRVDKEMAEAFIYVAKMVRHASQACWSPNPVEAVEALTKTTLGPLRNVFVTLPPQLDIVRYELWESPLRWQLRKERLDLLRNMMPMLKALSGVLHELYFVQDVRQEKDKDYKLSARDVLCNRLEKVLEPFLDALEAMLERLGKVLNPSDVATEVPFDDLKEATSQLQSAIDKIHFDVMSFRIGAVEPVWYMHIIFAHLMMVLLGEELLKYYELMRNFDRSRYISTGRSCLNFFFLEYWNDFWTELPKRLTLATPRDVRLAKDAFKIALAYTVGCFFTLYIDTDNVYYFGMAILMGVGLPTAGDTLVAGMQRVAGLLFAMGIAYLVDKHHFNNIDKYTYALLAIMIALFCRVFPAYLNCSLYCAILIPSMLRTVITPLTVLSRLVSNSLTVMAYYAIVVFIFPIDTIKVLHNTEVQIMEGISNNLSELMQILNIPINENDNDVKTKLLILKNQITNVWIDIRKISKLISTAAGEPTLRGTPYPVHEQIEFEPVLHHLAASLDIILLGLCCIHRQRIEPIEINLKQILLSIESPMKNICFYSLNIMQDFVDAVQIPEKWSYSQSIEHFFALTQLIYELKEVFTITHQNIMNAIRIKANELRVNNLKLSLSSNIFNPSIFTTSDLNETHIPYGIHNEFNNINIQTTEREKLTAPRNASFMLKPEEFTINHDMNMSIAILVGIDLFCSELEKILRIMLHLNEFECNRYHKFGFKKTKREEQLREMEKKK